MLRFIFVFIGAISFNLLSPDVLSFAGTKGGLFAPLPPSSPPVIKEGTSLSLNTSENKAISFSLYASDVNGDRLTWSLIRKSLNSSITGFGSGDKRSFVYTPNTGFIGNDSITIQVSDGSLTDSIVINVNIGLDAPISVWVPNIIDASIHDLNISLKSIPTSGTSYQIETRIKSSAGILSPWKVADVAMNNPPITPTSTLYYRVSNVSLGIHLYRARSCKNSICSAWTNSNEIQVVNTAPTISPIANQVIDEDTKTNEINFNIYDRHTHADSLIISVKSNNNNLVAKSDTKFSGGFYNRSIQIMPVADQSGIATIEITVSDGSLSASTSFQLTVTEVNDAPVVILPNYSPVIKNQSIEIAIEDFKIVDNDSQSWTLKVEEGVGYSLIGNTITVTTISKKMLYVPISVTDNGGLSTLMTLNIPVGKAVKLGGCDLDNQQQTYLCESCLPQIVVVSEACSAIDLLECEPNE